jgi:putative transposase
VVTPEHRRTAVTLPMTTAEVSERRACRFTGFARASQRYGSRRPMQTALREHLLTLATLRPRWGYRRLYVLLRREGWLVNRNLVQRLYREEGFVVRRRKRKRVAVPRTLPPPLPTRANERWSMDFVSDALGNGRKIRALTLVDDFTRECPVIEVDFSLPGERVIRVLEQLARTRGLPTSSAATTARSSRARCWISGRMRTACSSISSTRESRRRTRSQRASMAGCGTRA